jgi:hypothetical protein
MEKRGTNEIDLLELIAKSFNVLRENLILTILFPLVGLGIALALSSRNKVTIQSEMLIETKLLREQECEFLFKQVGKSGGIPGITPEVEPHLVSLGYEVTGSETSTPLEKTVYLKINATVSDKAVFPSLEKIIINFINESEPVVRNRKEKEKFYSSMISKIDAEIQAMETLQSRVANAPVTYLDPSELYEAGVKIFKERMECESKLEDIKTIHVIKGFDTLTYNSQLSDSVVGFIGFVIGFMVLAIILFIKFFVQYYRAYTARR